MPYEYTIDRSSGLILERWSGEVTAEEVQACHEAQGAHPEFQSSLGGLADFTGARLNLTYADLVRIADTASGSPIATRGPWALVMPGDLEYGIGRTYEALTRDRRPIRVFRYREEAMAWLEVMVQPPEPESQDADPD